MKTNSKYEGCFNCVYGEVWDFTHRGKVPYMCEIVHIPLNAVLVEDKNGGYTAWFKEYPSIIAEGDSVAETLQNIRECFSIVADYCINKRDKDSE